MPQKKIMFFNFRLILLDRITFYKLGLRHILTHAFLKGSIKQHNQSRITSLIATLILMYLDIQIEADFYGKHLTIMGSIFYNISLRHTYTYLSKRKQKATNSRIISLLAKLILPYLDIQIEADFCGENLTMVGGINILQVKQFKY